jgi:hypothetical protein
MPSSNSSTRKQPAMRRLLGIVLRRAHRAAFVVCAALALLIAAGGARLPLLNAARAQWYAAPEQHARAYSRLGPRVAVQPDDIVKDGVVIGRDPDPFIRGEMLRHYGVGGP